LLPRKAVAIVNVAARRDDLWLNVTGVHRVQHSQRSTEKPLAVAKIADSIFLSRLVQARIQGVFVDQDRLFSSSRRDVGAAEYSLRRIRALVCDVLG
jgi:hypothetical protein